MLLTLEESFFGLDFLWRYFAPESTGASSALQAPTQDEKLWLPRQEFWLFSIGAEPGYYWRFFFIFLVSVAISIILLHRSLDIFLSLRAVGVAFLLLILEETSTPLTHSS